MRASCTARMDADWSTGDAVAVPVLRCVADSGDAGRQAVPLRDAEMSVTRVDLAAGEQLELPASAARVGMAILIEGDAGFAVDGAAMHAGARQVILNAHHGAVRGVWPAGGRVILAALPRNAIQASASASHGGARRLARAAFVFGADLAALDAGHAREDAVIRAVVAALAAHYGIDDACPASRSISLARRRLDADPARAWDLEDLARGVGVTRITLQRGFRDCIGATVAGYAQALRLADARARLTSGRETRPLNAIAHAAGFTSATAFARAYQRMFGETPTRTRANFARSFCGGHIESG